MENVNMVPDMDQAYEDSFYKIIELLETKKYFHARDELLKHKTLTFRDIERIRKELEMNRRER